MYWALQKFSKYILGSPHKTTVYTDNSVANFIRTCKSAKMFRWKTVIDEFNINIQKRAGSKMFVSDALSRLFPIPSKKIIEIDESDNILDDFVVASHTVDKQTIDFTDLLQIHQKMGHCSSERLHRATNFPLDLCKKVLWCLQFM